MSSGTPDSRLPSDSPRFPSLSQHTIASDAYRLPYPASRIRREVFRLIAENVQRQVHEGEVDAIHIEGLNNVVLGEADPLRFSPEQMEKNSYILRLWIRAMIDTMDDIHDNTSLSPALKEMMDRERLKRYKPNSHMLDRSPMTTAGSVAAIVTMILVSVGAVFAYGKYSELEAKAEHWENRAQALDDALSPFLSPASNTQTAPSSSSEDVKDDVPSSGGAITSSWLQFPSLEDLIPDTDSPAPVDGVEDSEAVDISVFHAHLREHLLFPSAQSLFGLAMRHGHDKDALRREIFGSMIALDGNRDVLLEGYSLTTGKTLSSEEGDAFIEQITSELYLPEPSVLIGIFSQPTGEDEKRKELIDEIFGLSKNQSIFERLLGS